MRVLITSGVGIEFLLGAGALFARSPAPRVIVIGHVMRCREQPAQRNVRRYAVGTGQRADRKALAVEGGLLLPGRCVADAPAGVGQAAAA